MYYGQLENRECIPQKRLDASCCAKNSTEKRVRLKGTASVIGQFRREVIGPLSVKP